MKAHFHFYILVKTTLLTSVLAFGGSEEKFIKKYAMMKVYESCFGSEVLKEIRKEMKDAAQKCSGYSSNTDDKYFTKEGNNIKQVHSTDWLSESPYRVKPNAVVKVKKPIHTTDTLLLQQWTDEQKHNSSDGSMSDDQTHLETDIASNAEVETTSPTAKPVDLSKLEEAIMSIGKPLSSFAMHKQGATGSNYQQSAAVGYYPAVYYPPPVPFAPSYPYQPYYPGYFQAAGPAANPAFQSFYRSGRRSAKITKFDSRTSKQFDLKPQMDSLAFQYGTKLRNITCIMQELGYLDERLEPNYAKMNERINKLYISEELKRDILDGIRFCREFSQCVPESKRDSLNLSKELLRPMFFFRCYKHKKLESCIMKDIRERFSQTSAEVNNQVRRSFRNNDIVTSIFDSMFNPNGDDLDFALNIA